mmetsp:Transcript_126215/g.403980  ORF Transcript_126215/g.403980 Transcript_126215/m.403980 type:complete len:236 (+) Transcript_126215:68-775(+)
MQRASPLLTYSLRPCPPRNLPSAHHYPGAGLSAPWTPGAFVVAPGRETGRAAATTVLATPSLLFDGPAHQPTLHLLVAIILGAIGCGRRSSRAGRRASGRAGRCGGGNDGHRCRRRCRGGRGHGRWRDGDAGHLGLREGILLCEQVATKADIENAGVQQLTSYLRLFCDAERLRPQPLPRLAIVEGGRRPLLYGLRLRLEEQIHLRDGPQARPDGIGRVVPRVAVEVAALAVLTL